MKYFRAAVERARSYLLPEYRNLEGIKDLVPPATKFLDSAPDCRPMIFGEPLTREELHYNFTSRDPVVDLPFPACFVEVAGGIIAPGTLLTNSKELRDLVGVFVLEKSPFENEYLVLAERVYDDGGIFYVLLPLRDDKHVKRILFHFFNRLRSQTLAVEAVSQTINTGIGKEKRLHTIREVIHIRKSKIRIERGPNGGKMDYTHRFEIRGHWRKISGIGKDRNGSYAIKGATWVIPHVRGPEDKPLVLKQRVVHAEHTASV